MAKQIRPSVVLLKAGKILLLKSKYSSGEFYLLPGGKIEDLETIEEAAVRETKEETNYDIKISKLLYLQEWINKKRKKDILYAIFLGEIIGGEETHLNDPCLGKGNIKGIEWISIKKLGNIKFYPKDVVPLLKEDCKQNFKRFPVFLKPNVIN
jgi:8-oxo-dGTP diphosphatase